MDNLENVNAEAASEVNPGDGNKSRRYLLGGLMLLAEGLALVVFRLLFFYLIDWESDTLEDLLYTVVNFVLIMGLVPILFYMFAEKRSMKNFAGDFQLGKPDWVTILLSVVMIVPFFIMTMGISYICQLILIVMGYLPNPGDPTIATGFSGFIIAIAMTAVAPGIFEEFLYRGALRRSLTIFKKDTGVIVLTALCFSLGHQFILQTGYTFIGGLIFGFLAVKTKSLYPSIIVHFGNNALSVYLDHADANNWFLGDVLDEPNILGLIGLAILGIAVTMLLCFMIYKRTKKDGTQTPGTFINRFDPVTGARLPDVFLYRAPDAARFMHKPLPWENAVWAGAVALLALNTLFSFIWNVF